MDRTPAFHVGNAGSNPAGSTNWQVCVDMRDLVYCELNCDLDGDGGSCVLKGDEVHKRYHLWMDNLIKRLNTLAMRLEITECR